MRPGSGRSSRSGYQDNQEHQVRTGMVQIRAGTGQVKDQLVIDQEDIILLDLLAIGVGQKVVIIPI